MSAPAAASQFKGCPAFVPHPTSLSQLAFERGAYGEALALADAAIAQAPRGSDPSARFKAQVDRALALAKRNRFTESRRVAEAAVRGLKRVHGPRHPDTIGARLALASVYGEAGLTTEPEVLLRSLLAELRAEPCPDRERIADIQLYLSALLTEKDASERMRHGMEALAARRRLFGERHWKTVYAEIAVARRAFTRQGFVEAQPKLEAALTMLEPLGPNDPRRLWAVRSLAENLSAQQRHAEAEKIAREGWLRARQTYGESAQQTIALAETLAIALSGARRGDEAEQLLQSTMVAAEASLGPAHSRTKLLLFTVALIHQAQQKFDLAEDEIRRFNAWTVATYGGDHSHTLFSEYVLGNILYARGNKPAAAGAYRSVLQKASKSLEKDHYFYADLLQTLGYVLVEINLPLEARGHYESAYRAQAATWGEADSRTILTGCRLQHLRARQREVESAADAFGRLATQARLLPVTDGVRSECLLTYIELLTAVRKLDEARELLMTEYFPKGIGVETLRGTSLGPAYRLALLAVARGDSDEFERIMKAVVPLAISVSDDESLVALSIIAMYVNSLSVQQRSEEAFSVLKSAFVPVWNKSKKVHFLTSLEIFMGLSDVLIEMAADDTESLEEFYQLFTFGLNEIANILPQHPDLHDQLLNAAGTTAGHLRKLPEAERYLRELYARRLAAWGSEHPKTLTAQVLLGSVVSLAGKAEEGVKILRQVQPTYERLAVDTSAQLSLIEFRRILLSALLRASGHEAEALELARSVVADVRSWRAAITLDTSRLARFQRYAASEEVVFPPLADAAWGVATADPVRAAELRVEAYDALQRSLAGPASRAVALAAARNAAAQRNPRLAELARERQSLIDEWRKNEFEQVEALAASGTSSDAPRALEIRNAAIDARVMRIDAELRSNFGRFFSLLLPEPVGLTETRALLAPDEAALMIVSSSIGTHVMVVSKTDLRWVRVDLSVSDLSASVARLRVDLEAQPGTCIEPHPPSPTAGAGPPPAQPSTPLRRCGTFDRTTAWQLYNKLIAPVADALRGKRHVFTAVSGPLSALPLGVLVTEQPSGGDGDPRALRRTSWFADAYSLVEIPSIQALKFQRATARAARIRGSRFVGYGDPLLFGAPAARRSAPPANSVKASGAGEGGAIADVVTIRDLPRLPGTAMELYALRRALRAPMGSVRLREQASEAAVRAADLSSVDILAFATHGLVPWDVDGVSEPALVFTPPAVPSEQDDGVLTASEITGLRLNADWVILSACNSGGGQWLGAPVLSGLARAFFFAGARTLLVSHWPVRDDVAAAMIPDVVMRRRDNPNISRAEALQAAARAIRNSPDDSRAHPSAWAPLSLVGDAW